MTTVTGMTRIIMMTTVMIMTTVTGMTRIIMMTTVMIMTIMIMTTAAV